MWTIFHRKPVIPDKVLSEEAIKAVTALSEQVETLTKTVQRVERMVYRKRNAQESVPEASEDVVLRLIRASHAHRDGDE